MKGRLLLNVVVAEGPAVLKLLPSEDESLLVGWDTDKTCKYRSASPDDFVQRTLPCLESWP